MVNFLRFKPFILILIIVITSLFIFHHTVLKYTGYHPISVTQVDLRPILQQNSFTEADYTLIFEQTGIAKPIVDELKTMSHFTEKMLNFQDDYQRKILINGVSLPPLTTEEHLVDTSGNMVRGFELAPYHNGYIFLTKSTHTLGWRHGHAGLVIDEKRGKTLEALHPGSVSMEQDVSKWQYYPTFKMMRLKDVSLNFLNQIAEFASTHLRGLPYNILGYKTQGEQPIDTHCSLLVWQAFNAFGYDLDANVGRFVSPQNIAASPYLETLQIFGFNPSKAW